MHSTISPAAPPLAGTVSDTLFAFIPAGSFGDEAFVCAFLPDMVELFFGTSSKFMRPALHERNLSVF